MPEIEASGSTVDWASAEYSSRAVHMLRRSCLVIALSLAAIMGLPFSAHADIKPFLNQFCVRCHGETKAEGKLSLHALPETEVNKADVAKWKAVFDKLETGEMPPDDAKQPTLEQRFQTMQAIRTVLKKAGEPVVDIRRQHPSRGNAVDHDTLFSGKAMEPSATQARLWRLTGQAYEEFFLKKNLQFKLEIKTYGPTRVQSRWNFTPQRDFRDYASSHTIGEAEIEYHMRNATQVAQAMVKKFSGSKPSAGDWIQELNVVLKAGEKSTAEQIKSATKASFKLVLEREPSAREIERYSGFLAGNLKTLGADKAVEQLLIAILFQPEVTYRIEVVKEGTSRAMIPSPDLARAISFALTDRVPDEALLKSATEGKLVTREEVRAQVMRMLNDGRIEKPRILRFFQEYFGHHAAAEVFKDEVTLAAYGMKRNGWHPTYFISDSDRLIEWVLAADKNVLYELLTTSKTFTLTMDPKGRDKAGEGTRKSKGTDKPFQLPESTTLNLYEIPLKSRLEWTDEKPFEMPPEHRMGLLTHPSWLVAQSGNFDNHAIHRGRWIREKLFGGQIPDVPITVNAMLPDEPHRTLRDRMKVTQAEYCWKCHRQMDPLGLPFEQFDHFGRFRTAEMVVDTVATTNKSNLNNDGRPRQTKYMTAKLDTTGHVEQSGDAKLDGLVKDPFELIRKLASSERVQQVFVRHAFRYFVGRIETLEDGPTLVAAYQAYSRNGGSMNALITSLLTSDAFLYRTSEVPVQHTPEPRKPDMKGTSP
jgi:Protein of unknown function (DUF1588)/Protein of unknown function (DUF1592)/Protein of unknown function (DUF1585)/Planctomycete cytochrome C